MIRAYVILNQQFLFNYILSAKFYLSLSLIMFIIGKLFIRLDSEPIQ
jgi:hypothetical protein